MKPDEQKLEIIMRLSHANSDDTQMLCVVGACVRKL